MENKNRIILPHGNLTKLASEFEDVGERTCSNYLRGWFDDNVQDKAMLVRKLAVEKYGGVLCLPRKQ